MCGHSMILTVHCIRLTSWQFMRCISHDLEKGIQTMRRASIWLARLGFFVLLTLSFVGCQQQPVGVRSATPVAEQSTPTVAPSPTSEGRTIINGSYPCGPLGLSFPNLGAERHVLAWTPDGAHLLFNYVSVEGKRLDHSPYDHTAFWRVDAAGIKLDMLVDANPGHASEYGHYAAISPDGTRLVYASCESSKLNRSSQDRALFDYEVVVISIDGTGQRWLTSNSYLDHYPVWSPEGSRIAFLATSRTFGSSGDDDGNLGLYTMAADGTDVQRVAPPGEYGLTLAPPVWSPDGERLAFLANAGPVDLLMRNLYTVRVDGSEMTLLAEEVVSVPAWSPDGQRLAVAKYAGDDVALFTLAADGSDTQFIATITTREELRRGWEPYRSSIHTVAWSPDGTQLLYSCDVGVCVVNIENGQVIELEDRLGGWPGPHFAAWSPDGARIAIYMPANYYGGELVELFTVAPDGTDRRDLIRADRDGNLVPANPPE